MARAHGGAGRGFEATITRMEPAAAPVEAEILEGDDRVVLTVTDAELVIHGYEGEPYIRFGQGGVFRNERSPATYQNDERYGIALLPTQADARAAPDWRQVADGGEPYEWHDHRIHWMSRSDPPAVVADRDSPHRIFDWRIPGTLDGKPFAIAGRLDYSPPPGQRFPRILLLPLGLLAVGGIALVVVRQRAERSKS